ncbi:MAG TPA: hypothetical protein VK644_14990 [Chitinophagaceae bacterium]|nr:hypothetical protein [Chitinophagaceae bacterium]
MNERTELLEKKFKPRLAIMVYKSEQTMGHPDHYHLESHQINEAGQILEGKPLLHETIAGMVSIFHDQNRDRSILCGAIPDNLLFYRPNPGTQYNLAWYRPAELRYHHFADQLRIKSGRIWTPPLLYLVENGELYVFAMKKDDRPTEKTKLFRSPYHNVSENGKVCLGNAKVRKPIDKNFISTIKYWEDLFWLSEFSHLNGATTPTKSELKDIYTKLVNSKEKVKWSDLQELKESKRLIKNIIQ